MSHKKIFFLSILSGIIFSISWPPYGFPILLFIAFVPLLQIEHAFSSGQTALKTPLLFALSFITFFIWNVTTTFWVCNASLGGGAMAILANSFIMAAVFWIFHLVKKRLLIANWQLTVANLVFVFFWLGYEFFHHRWDLTWPWLALGNALAENHTWIQWYEYTGVPGGSLWILALNLMFFEWLNGNPKSVYKIITVILLPVLISWTMYYGNEYGVKNSSSTVNVVVVQPNIDPYSEKFDGVNFSEQLEKMLALALQKTDSTTDYLVFPETSLTESIWENDLERTSSIQRLRNFLKSFPRLKIIVGASTWYLYEAGEKHAATTRKFKNQRGYYDAFNAAFQIDNSDSIQKYHKSKLVPGVERMPYPEVFGFLENFAIDLGGASGSLGIQEERAVFNAPSDSPKGGEAEISVAPVICYESIFGEFVTEYVKKGATLIFIITNDGWWRDTPGYKQHLEYAKLRAIETRRCIARSANTGISCFINERGDISQPTKWWEPTVIQENISSNSEETFYVEHGDIIGRVCFYLSGIILLFAIALPIIKKK